MRPIYIEKCILVLKQVVLIARRVVLIAEIHCLLVYFYEMFKGVPFSYHIRIRP